MARYAKEQQDDSPGGDSFLDIVANIVGILILLVMVVGLRAAREFEAAPVAQTEVERVTAADLRKAKDRALRERREFERLVLAAKRTEAESRLLEADRVEMASYIAELDSELEKERAALSESDRRSHDTSTSIAHAQLRLEELMRKRVSQVVVEQETETIECYPTPIAQGVVEDQVMISLEGNQISFLPIAGFVDQIERAIGSVRAELMNSSGMEVVAERRLGPVEGHYLACRFKRQTINVPGRGMMAIGGMERCTVVATPSVQRTPADLATEPGSPLMQRLEGIDRDATVVTIIAYPDSFESLAKVERSLKEHGYRVAKTLQRAGQPISFGPNGRETVMQ
ncbi:hypothetical protein Mal64_31460 [Pseudobythopirellula maris]|uniref:Uncharacterized protein n=1 Tax=Pseudobythopirellula maris TaxID=2527991 RepID=A0A5C5ZJN0_9BACT|nr:hypothetical protein [Pseudobythopirellula maris]TWT87604.1 hypothetical protein Mal64_31460 [Pseudobythopirellula maris]